MREMGLMDWKSSMSDARREGREEGREEVARKALMNGFSIDQIHAITGLDADTIKKLGTSMN
jgi:predicted transposase YdaD